MPDPGTPRSAGEPGEVRMSFAEHLEELRKRLFRGALAIAAVFCVGWFVFPEPLERFFLRPHFQAVERLKAADPPVIFEPRLQVQSPLEQIFYRAKVAILVALLVGFPYLLYQLWAFVAAGLYKHERRAVMRYMPWSLALAFAGMAFGYLLMVPFVLQYLYSIPDQGLFLQSYRLQYYFSLFLLFTLALAAVFQLPVLMLGLHSAGIGEAAFYRKYRRHFVVAAFVFAAVVTPPEPVSQILMAIPMLLLYELGVWGIALSERRRRRREGGA